MPEHWYDAWDRTHEAQQARTKARNLEFIFLDMASQALTMWIQQTGAKV